jgi:RNA polymerase sigma-70 factor (ECF subfamily)
MPDEPVMTGDFHADLKMMLPRLRVYALALTRDHDRADDLLQQTVVKSLAGRASFRPGTNFGAWLIRIQRNEFISGLRRERVAVCFDELITNSLSYPPPQESGLVLREFLKAFGCLSSTQRESLLLVALEGYSYRQIAEHCAVSIGTVKSRLWRARATLNELLTDERAIEDRTTMHAPAARRSGTAEAPAAALQG